MRFELTNTFDRAAHLEKIKHLRIIDVGGSTSFADGHLEAIADFQQAQARAQNFFKGNINMPEMWEQVHAYVKKHGKFDYAICTHTLEDISNPFFVCQQIEKIANAGLIIVPSKYIELSRFNHFRGFIHHRWIFDFINGQFTGFPKVNLIEHERFTHHITTKNELVYEWEGAINLQLINNDWLGPDNAAVESYYDQLIDWK